jgi:hypothetical protein
VNKAFIVFSISILAIVLKASGQSYNAFPDSNACWTVLDWYVSMSSCPSTPIGNPIIVNIHFSYFIQGDSVINNISYHKIYQSAGTLLEYCSAGNSLIDWHGINSDYIGGLRQDTILKRVYFVYSSGPEFLLYDFRLNVSDTLFNSPVCDGCIVSSIDSTPIGNSYRKTLHFNETNFIMIEGIGSTGGLLAPIDHWENGGTLECYSQNNFTIFPDTNTECNMVIGINKINEAINFSIVPNPFHENATVKINNAEKIEKLQIFDFSGRLVFETKDIRESLQIDAKLWRDGIYLLKLTGKYGKNQNSRFIIN